MASTSTSPQVVEDVVFDALAQLGPDRDQIRRESTFEELDIDSLDIVEIAQIADETWGIDFDPQDLASIKTVGEACDLILARMS